MISSIYELGVNWRDHNMGGYSRPNRKKGNVSYEGPTLYSRTTPVARFHTSSIRQKYILIQSRRYSISTDQQISKCIRYDIPAFRVPNIGATGGWSAEISWSVPELMHKANLEYLVSVVEAFEHEAIKGYRSGSYPFSDSYWHKRLIELCEVVHKYEFMSGVKAELEGISHIGQRIEKARAAKLAVYDSPINVAKRERAAARRLAKKALGL
jgi:hypothetical protein